MVEKWRATINELNTIGNAWVTIQALTKRLEFQLLLVLISYQILLIGELPMPLKMKSINNLCRVLMIGPYQNGIQLARPQIVQKKTGSV